MNWLKEITGKEKAIIAMCHLKALPGDPRYDQEKGMEFVVKSAKEDLANLQEGGVDAIMFSNEYSLPYLTNVRVETVASMARIIGEIKDNIKVPFGVNVLWDAEKSLDLAVATDALFVREIFTGVYSSDFGLWNTNVGKTVRHQYQIGAENIKLIFNIVPEASSYLSQRDVGEIAKTTVFNCRPDAICVSGITAGEELDLGILKKVKDLIPDTIVLNNTGMNMQNIEKILEIADGGIVGTTFKIDGNFMKQIDKNRVRQFMDKVNSYRS